jgi:hypothetical protein
MGVLSERGERQWEQWICILSREGSIIESYEGAGGSMKRLEVQVEGCLQDYGAK